MLGKDRLRHVSLFKKIVSPRQAATLIQDQMTVGVSGFTPSGYPKAVTLALAEAVEAGAVCRVNLWSGASVGPEIEEALAAVGAVSRRMPYYAASNKSMRTAINQGQIHYCDMHLSHMAQQIDYGFLGAVDIAIVEAVAITENGDLVLGPGVGNTPMLVKHAKQVIVEINTAQPLALEGMHDNYLLDKPPFRREIPIYQVKDRIGSPYVTCGFDKIACIVASDIPDQVRNLEKANPQIRRMARHLIAFLKQEQAQGKLPDPLLPIQSGVGNIANAVLGELENSDFENLQMYSEILQDAVFTLIDKGKIIGASGCAFTPSPDVLDKFKRDPEKYKRAIVLRPLDISNHPEIIRRLGVISINTPLEFDIYGNSNSTHIAGTHMMNGIGGSGDYMRNGYLTIFITESTAKEGLISRVVPMVTHSDHSEHDAMVYITEYGVADVRGLSPRERAEAIIEHCAHPDYRALLHQYVNTAIRTYGGHSPHDLEQAFSFHRRLRIYGSMKAQEAQENESR